MSWLDDYRARLETERAKSETNDEAATLNAVRMADSGIAAGLPIALMLFDHMRHERANDEALRRIPPEPANGLPGQGHCEPAR